jgi:hypothetical protein
MLHRVWSTERDCRVEDEFPLSLFFANGTYAKFRSLARLLAKQWFYNYIYLPIYTHASDIVRELIRGQ